MFKILFSKQKWLINNLPNHKITCDDLVRDCIYNILVHFIEVEQGLDDNYWLDDENGSVKEKLIKCYKWITEDRLILISKLEQTEKDFPIVPENDNLFKFLNDSHVSDILKLQQELKDRDNNVLDFILKHREYLTIVK